MNTKNNKTPVIIQNYIWFWSCCICNKKCCRNKKNVLISILLLQHLHI